MELYNLHDQLPGLKRGRKRLGRGHGSGLGKTSGKGHKGQKARVGGSIRIGFESGHIPLYRKLPRRGFSNARFAVDYAIVNVGDLQRVEVSEIGPSELVAAGLVNRRAKIVKLLGDGEIDRPVVITADMFSAGAVRKIEAAGGRTIRRGSESE